MFKKPNYFTKKRYYCWAKSKIKFVNSEHLTGLENRLSQATQMESKISYNSFRNNGKIVIKFSDFEKVQQLLEALEKVSREN